MAKIKAKKPEVLRASIISFLKEGVKLVDTLKTDKDLESEETQKKFIANFYRCKLTIADHEAFDGIADHLVPMSKLTLKGARETFSAMYTLLTGEKI